MGNLLIDARGTTWCPKVNGTVKASSPNGCFNCPYNKGFESTDGKTGRLTCSLVPANGFCKRIHHDEAGAMWCLRDATLEEYREGTGDLAAEEVPEGVRWPRPTTFLTCWVCATLKQNPSEPVPEEIENVQKKLESIQSSGGDLDVPFTPAVRAMRRSILELNPGWKERYDELERQADSAEAATKDLED